MVSSARGFYPRARHSPRVSSRGCPPSAPSSSTSTASSWTAKRPEYESHRRIYERCGVDADRRRVVRRDRHLERRARRAVVQRGCAREPRGAPARDAYFAERRRIFEEIVPGRSDARRSRAAGGAARRGDSGGDRFVGAGALGGRRGRAARHPSAVRRGRDRRRGGAPEAGARRLSRSGAPARRRSGAVGRDRGLRSRHRRRPRRRHEGGGDPALADRASRPERRRSHRGARRRADAGSAGRAVSAERPARSRTSGQPSRTADAPPRQR